MKINISLLFYELIQASLPVVGVSLSPSDEFPDCRIDWKDGHPTPAELIVAHSVYDAHDPSKLLPEEQAAKDAIINYAVLPDWVKSGTADQAETYLTQQIFNGMSQADVETWIDTNISDVTANTVAQINTRLAMIRQGLKLAASAIITMRGLFIITAKLLIYIRDLVIRFRQQ